MSVVSEEIKLPLEVLAPLLREKLSVYIGLFDYMDENDGWFRYPDVVIEFFNKLGVRHWAELYSREGKESWLKCHEAQILEGERAFVEALGQKPDIASATKLLTEIFMEFCEAIARGEELPGLELIDPDLSRTDLDALPESDLQQHRDKWITYLVLFYDDLSWAAHGESIHTLVSRAVDALDHDALFKAVQIDRSLIVYFQDQLHHQSLKGNSDFFDSLAYRVKNPPKRGLIKHPLLWILFKDLQVLRCLHRGISGREILDLYQSVVGDHPKLAIDDELIVQRQRRKFMEMHRHPK